MATGLYAFGFLIVIIGVAYMAHLMHIPQIWIGAIILILVGVGFVAISQNLKQKS